MSDRYQAYFSHSGRPADVDLNLFLWDAVHGDCRLLVDTYKDKNQKTRGCHIAARKLAQAYQAQIAAFRRFRALSEELLEVSQTMADLAVGKKGAPSRSAR